MNMDADDGVSRRLIVQQLLNLREKVRSVLKDENGDKMIVVSTGDDDSDSGSASGSTPDESGSGDNVLGTTTRTNVAVLGTPSKSPGINPLLTTDESVMSTGNSDDTEGSGTNGYSQYSTTSTSTTDDEDATGTDKSVISTGDTDDTEGSGTMVYNQYTTTSTSIPDDEDLDRQSGSGNNETMADPTMDDDNSYSVPTTIVKTTHLIFGDTTVLAGSGSCINLISYIFVLFVTLVGFVNM